MATISIADLRAHLSAQVKKATAGEKIVILDHKRPVAVLGPLGEVPLVIRQAGKKYVYRDLEPLMDTDPLIALWEERGDR